MTEMMTCYEIPSKNVFGNDSSQDFNTSSDSSLNSDDSSPPLKKPHLNENICLSTGIEDTCSSPISVESVEWPEPVVDLAPLINFYGPDFDVAKFMEHYDKNSSQVGVWDPLHPEVVITSNVRRDPDVDYTSKRYVKLALEYLKEKGEEYVMVQKSPIDYPIWSKGVTHLNFYALSEVSQEEHFFFAEIYYPEDKVLSCSIVNPEICGPEDIIIHSEDVECSHCNTLGWGYFELESDEDI